MSRELLAYAKNHIAVFYDPEHSHAVGHFASNPDLRGLVKEIIQATLLTNEYMWFETDMGRIVGMSSLVETDNSDEIVYAKRLNHTTYTRFTKSRKSQPSSIVTIALNPIKDQAYELTSAWIGPVGYSFPDDPAAAPESHLYWENHALVWGTQAIQAGTETAVCPW